MGHDSSGENKMKAKLNAREEHYTIEGTDESGLIPKGAAHAVVSYNPRGEINFIFYAPAHNREMSTDKRREKSDRISEEYLKQTHEQRKKAVGLLRKLAGEKK